MMIPLLQEAVDALSSVPGIGKVTAMRMALFLLRRPEEETLRMGNALIRLRTEARYCRTGCDEYRGDGGVQRGLPCAGRGDIAHGRYRSG